MKRRFALLMAAALLFVLAESGGRAVVRPDGGEESPAESVDPRALRAADREKLKLGIETESRRELLMLIEDLGS